MPLTSPTQIEYDFAASILMVTIAKCEELAAMDLGGTSDPYVKVRKQLLLIKGWQVGT